MAVSQTLLASGHFSIEGQQFAAGPLRLEVSEIDGYDQNPRLFRNESYEGLEASLRAHGLTDALTVTRRPGVGGRFMLAAGSNTTLEILKSLWRSTGDERYRWVHCIYQPYESEARLLAQHLSENLNRSNMRFWEVAKAMVELLHLIVQDEYGGRTPGLREQAEALVRRGLRADRTAISRWRFAVERLSPLGAAAPGLTGQAVGDLIQPRLLALKALGARFSIDEATFWASLVTPVLESVGAELATGRVDVVEPIHLCERVEAALADRCEETVDTVRHMLSVLKLAPELTLAQLRMPSPNLVAGSAQPALSGAPRAAGTESAPQAPLPLGPVVVQSSGRRPGSMGTATASDSPVAPASPLDALHADVVAVLEQVHLPECFRIQDAMPLGFYIELPDPGRHARQSLVLGSEGFDQRAVKSNVWWTLVLLSGQFREGAAPLLDPDSAFYRHMSAGPAAPHPLQGTDVDVDPPEAEQLLLHQMSPGLMGEAMRKLVRVLTSAARVFACSPERWRLMARIHIAP